MQNNIMFPLHIHALKSMVLSKTDECESGNGLLRWFLYIHVPEVQKWNVCLNPWICFSIW